MEDNIINNINDINMIIYGKLEDINRIVGDKFSFNNIDDIDSLNINITKDSCNIYDYMKMIDRWGCKSDALDVTILDKKCIGDKTYYNINYRTKYNVPKKYIYNLYKKFPDIFVILLWSNIKEKVGGVITVYKGIEIKKYTGYYFNKFLQKYYSDYNNEDSYDKELNDIYHELFSCNDYEKDIKKKDKYNLNNLYITLNNIIQDF